MTQSSSPPLTLTPLNPLRAATLSVADLDVAIERYNTWLNYSVIERGTICEGVASALAAPVIRSARMAVLRPASGREVDLRLIELPAVVGYRPMRTFGWAALEICVEDVLATHQRLQGSPFTVIGPPSAIPGLPTIHPMQMQGPDGEVLFLTEIKQGGPGSGLPTARSPIDTLFIAVLACRDLPMMTAWTQAHLDATIAPAIEIPYRTISRAFGMPETQRHQITTAERGGHIFLELDRYPAEATERPTPPDMLPPGVSVITLIHPDLASVRGPWVTPPTPRDGVIYQGRRTGVLRTPEGALIELIEADA